MINSICPLCPMRYKCPANDSDIVRDDLTFYVVDCDIFDYLQGESEAKK